MNTLDPTFFERALDDYRSAGQKLIQKSESQIEMTNDMLACLRAYVTNAWRMTPKRGGKTSKNFLAKLKSGDKTRKRKQGPRLTEFDTPIGQVRTLVQPKIRNFRIKRT